ncbi:hypothetical protein ACW2AE_00775 [Limosilactobacillus fermentum]
MADQATIPRYHFEDWRLLSDQPLAFEDSDRLLAEGLLDSDLDDPDCPSWSNYHRGSAAGRGLLQGVILTDIFSVCIYPALLNASL